jgi:hypothetical protein
MVEKTPAEAFMAWIRLPGLGQTFLRWFALIPSVVFIFLFLQLILLSAISLISSGNNQNIVSWLMNILNAAFVPFLIIKYATPIAPSFHRNISIVLAFVAICLVVLSRLSFELSHPSDANWRYIWLAVGAIVCCASVWCGMHDVNCKMLLAKKTSPENSCI